MSATIEQAVAELVRDGDPARGILGLNSLRGWGLYDDADPTARKIFVGEAPPEPDELAEIVRDGGLQPVEGSQGNGIGRRPSVTVLVRSASYATASKIADECFQILDEYEGLKADVPIFRMNANAEAIPLGRDREDAGGRWLVTQSFRAITKRYALT